MQGADIYISALLSAANEHVQTQIYRCKLCTKQQSFTEHYSKLMITSEDNNVVEQIKW